MNREVLFRGKSIDTGAWVEGYLYIHAGGTEYEQAYILGELDHRESIYDIWKCAECVDLKTVGEFTGALTGNGTKIFEGDIVDTPRWVVTYGDGMKCFSGMQAGWYIQRDRFESWMELVDTEDLKVIGNIHDNPELLWR